MNTTRGRIRCYVKDIKRHFGDFSDHPAVELAAQLHVKHQMSL